MIKFDQITAPKVWCQIKNCTKSHLALALLSLKKLYTSGARFNYPRITLITETRSTRTHTHTI